MTLTCKQPKKDIPNINVPIGFIIRNDVPFHFYGLGLGFIHRVFLSVHPLNLLKVIFKAGITFKVCTQLHTLCLLHLGQQRQPLTLNLIFSLQLFLQTARFVYFNILFTIHYKMPIPKVHRYKAVHYGFSFICPVHSKQSSIYLS